MTRWRLRTSLLFAGILLLQLHSSLPAAAQEAGRYTADELVHEPGEYQSPRLSTSPSGGAWRSLQDDRAFGYGSELEYVPAPQQQRNTPARSSAAAAPRESTVSKAVGRIVDFLKTGFGTILLWSLLVAVVGFVVYRIVGGAGFGKSRRFRAPSGEASDGSGDEEDLSSDWEVRMRRAVAAGNLRLALRCGYMRYLQLLQEAGQIRYRQDRTNMDYYRELSNAGLKEDFRQMSRQYEFAWYGSFEPSPAAFAAFTQTLDRTRAKLSAA